MVHMSQFIPGYFIIFKGECATILEHFLIDIKKYRSIYAEN